MNDDVMNQHPSDAPPFLRTEYEAIAGGERRTGPRGRLLFCVSTVDLTETKGDLYVALGLAHALNNAGWGVSLWPSSRFADETPGDIDVAILMLESQVPGLIHSVTKVVAWVRNWTNSWAALPYLDSFSEIWCSSMASAERIADVFEGPIQVVPLATDPKFFAHSQSEKIPGVVTTANFWGVERAIRPALEAVSATTPVTWFGANSRFLKLQGAIDHRDAINYFELPAVYTSWAIVVDDLIPAAAEFGNHNSRLFDALACGALVITNSSTGLDELGLGDVPTYLDGADLATQAARLLDDIPATSAIAAKLRAIVLERHTWDARADQLSAGLEGLCEARPTPRPPLLRWSAAQAEEIRSLRAQRDSLSVWYNDKQEEIAHMSDEFQSLVGQSAEINRILHGIRTSRSYRLAHILSRVWALPRRR